MKKARARLVTNFSVIAISILVALYLVSSETAEALFLVVNGWGYLGSFIAGALFTSIFTTAPAIVLLGELAQVQHPLSVALVGGAGAALGDYIIFRLMRDRFAEDIALLLRRTKIKRFPLVCRTRLCRRFVPSIGALIIASPLPDELGLAFIGFSRIQTKAFFLLSFSVNAAGIFVIGLLARSAG